MENPNKPLSAEELLPCPFCGNPTPENVKAMGEAWVLCGTCKASSGMVSGDDATEEWNTRVQKGEADLRAALEVIADGEGEAQVIAKQTLAAAPVQQAAMPDALHQARIEGVKLALEAAIGEVAVSAVTVDCPQHRSINDTVRYAFKRIRSLSPEDIIKGGQGHE